MPPTQIPNPPESDPPESDPPESDPIENVISFAAQINEMVAVIGTQAFQNLADTVTETTAKVTQEASGATQKLVEVTTETVGQTVDPIAQNPVVNYLAKIPGLGWLLHALGKVNLDKAHREVAELRQTYPHETVDELAHRIILNTTLAAAGTGLVTNIVPPVALALFAVDLAAVGKLQAEMLYRIAGIYSFDLNDPARRGEAIAVFTASLSTAGVIKTGLSAVELVPAVGAVVGASTNGALVYTLGIAARQFYENLGSGNE
ncbi:MAG: EcsC family protein [Cyanobacteria bacterium P01_F01_bin.4]